MGHDRGDCMSIIHSSEDEEGYSRSIFWMKNHRGIFGETTASRKIVSDDTDQQFWAEDELSSSDSRPIVFKHKRRHSVAHRNRTYRSRSRLNRTSSSSSYLSNAKIPPVRRRRKLQSISLEEELKRNPELKKSDIQILQDWCAKQPHLPKIADNELARFLHSNYYRIEPTKNTIDTFYTVRTHVPEFFSNRDPLGNKDLRSMFQTAAYMPLPDETPEGYKIIYGRLINYDPSAYVYNDAMKYWNMVCDLWMTTEGTMKGHIILVDLAGLAFGHTGRLSPMGIKKFLYYLQEGLPVRLKGLHFTNSVPVMEIILGMMKPFMKKELMEILHIHSTPESVAKHIPLDILPYESGGKAGSLMELHEKNIKWLETHRAWFLEDEAKGRVNESLRPGKGKSATDLFGVEGSFKKLDID
ncbi:hypothetical protein PV327_001160 [Microctonus hyperodae]|uniref:CRAL-TRIO domain-containing protein n=1 Tax=Microctonus hyperodae TaxID=165561 RepID=A0AA39G804_MICHY|nr:hypothetical protein PV327_001160 [Microctonus hyperodae]